MQFAHKGRVICKKGILFIYKIASRTFTKIFIILLEYLFIEKHCLSYEVHVETVNIK